MKWNASLVAALSLLLAACGGGRGYSEYGLEPAPAQPGSIAAQSWGGVAAPQQYRPEQVPPQQAYPANPGPGASYAPPGSGYAPQPGSAVPRGFDGPPQDRDADPAAGATGPRRSSQRAGGEARYDEIGYAGVRGVAGGGAADAAVVAVHRSLPPDTYVEVTSLETGRTILVLITGAMGAGADHPMDLSTGAARQLGYDGTRAIPVRIRKVNASPPDMALLRSGRPAADRADTPPVLLNALRRHLPATAAAAAQPAPAYSRPAAPSSPRTASGRGFYVQVAALSNARNAQALAQSMGGFVKQGGGLHRVQLGPFASQREAEQARAGAARAGYRDARVFAVN